MARALNLKARVLHSSLANSLPNIEVVSGAVATATDASMNVLTECGTNARYFVRVTAPPLPICLLRAANNPMWRVQVCESTAI